MPILLLNLGMAQKKKSIPHPGKFASSVLDAIIEKHDPKAKKHPKATQASKKKSLSK